MMQRMKVGWAWFSGHLLPHRVRVLNDGSPSTEITDPHAIVDNVVRITKDIFDAFVVEGKEVDYSQIRQSEHMKEWIEFIPNMRVLDLAALSADETSSLFINTYNMLTIHAITFVGGKPKSVLEIPKFWGTFAYCIGGQNYTLDEMEHGVLRGNRKHPSSSTSTFLAESDPKAEHAVKEVDPRIHFALVCGANSCPPLRAFNHNNLRTQLQQAGEEFCAREIQIDVGTLTVRMSKLLMWYGSDFGSTDLEKLTKLKEYMSGSQQEAAQAILDAMNAGKDVTFTYNDYDWTLNAK